MDMETCPKFQRCSAPVCPLDLNWWKACHLKHERICFYLCESQKGDSEAILRGRGLGNLYQIMVEVTPGISLRWATIRKALEKAKNTSSRINKKLPSINNSCSG